MGGKPEKSRERLGGLGDLGQLGSWQYRVRRHASDAIVRGSRAAGGVWGHRPSINHHPSSDRQAEHGLAPLLTLPWTEKGLKFSG